MGETWEKKESLSLAACTIATEESGGGQTETRLERGSHNTL